MGTGWARNACFCHFGWAPSGHGTHLDRAKAQHWDRYADGFRGRMILSLILWLAGGSEMLSIRRRGSAGKWYVRGSVTLGDRSIDVTEFSTGTTDKAAARHLMGDRERELREELMFGPRVVAKRAVIADAFDAYLSKPKRPNSSDILRVAAQAEAVRDALESTPVLILGGRDDMRGDQRDQFDRIAVGHARDGATVIVGAFAQDQQTVSLAEFTKLVLAAAAIKHITIDGLLAMDGGPSAHLWFPAKNALYGHRGPSYLPSAICVTPR